MKYKKYPSYKDSGVEWLGEIPNDWMPIKIKHILSEKKKQTNPSLNSGSISFGEVVYKNDNSIPIETKANYQEVKVGEFLINPLNLNFDLKSLRTALSTINVVVSTGYIVLQSISNINKNYLRWILYQFDVAHMKTLGAGVRQTVNFTDIGNEYFYLPSSYEQQQIANFLDKATAKIDTLIGKQTKQIELLKEKRQAVISHAVTKGINPNVPMKDSGVEWLGEISEHWKILHFRRITSLQQGLQIQQDTRFTEEGNNRLEYITIKSINAGKERIHKEYIENANTNVICKNDDVLLARTGATGEVVTGLYGVFHNNFFKVNYNRQLITQDFLVYLLKNKELKNHLLMLAGTTTIPDLNHGAFLGTKIPLPEKEEQEIIVRYLDDKTSKMDKLIEKANKSIELLKEKRTALVSAAVTGKIDVRELV